MLYYSQKENKVQRGVQEGNHYMSDGRVMNIADTLDKAVSPFGDVITAGRTTVMALQSHQGINQERDYILEDGVYRAEPTRVQTPNNIWHQMSVSGSNQSTYFSTSQIGVYVSGYWAETGKGVQIPELPPEGLKAYWGYFDDQDGYGYMLDTTGLYIFVRRNGTDELMGQFPNQPNDTTTDKEGWNIDTASGKGGFSNHSNFKLDLKRGFMFQERFTHYGFGSIMFYVNRVDSDGRDVKLPLHKFIRENEILFNNPNLPIAMEITTDNTYTGGNWVMNVGGRQMSILGKYRPLHRFSREYRNLSGLSDGTWHPVVSTYTDLTNKKGIQSFVHEMTVSSNQNLVWGAFLNPSLALNGVPITTDDFLVPRNTTDDNRNNNITSMRFDITANEISGGVELIGDVVSPDQGNTKIRQDSENINLLAIPRDRIVTLAVKPLISNTDVFGNLRIRQEF